MLGESPSSASAPATVSSSTSPQRFAPPHNAAANAKRKRRPAGTPDPDAEVVSLSPRTLLESDRYVCEICNQGFQRDQNLQMHRRRHKVPWKLLKREASEVRKRVFVCPEPTCLHHDPCHALGDLVGIKKHFRRKHSSQRQWVCSKCCKAYAVQSDYKAHLKTCGTRGHSCDCGRVFSRVESFIEHQDICTAGRGRADLHISHQPPACLSRTASSPSPSSETNFSPAAMWPGAPRIPTPAAAAFFFGRLDHQPSSSQPDHQNGGNIELQLLPPSAANPQAGLPSSAFENDEDKATKLQLSIGPPAATADLHAPPKEVRSAAAATRSETVEQLRLAMAEKALADEARQQARRQLQLAEHEFENAKRIRQQAQQELSRALAIRERSVKQINATLLHVTCYACKQRFRAAAKQPTVASEENSFVVSHMSSVVTEGEVENDQEKITSKP